MVSENEDHIIRMRQLQKEGKMRSESESEGLPLILESTTQELIRIYGAAPEAKLPRYLPRQYDDKEDGEVSAYSRGLSIAQGLLGQLADDDDGYFDKMANWIENSFQDAYFYQQIDMQDSALIGVSVVLKALEMQEGQYVVENLKIAPRERILFAFDERGSVRSRISRIAQMRSGRRIPQHQASLMEGIDTIAQICLQPNAFREGAGMQYGVLEDLWKNLRIKEQE